MPSYGHFWCTSRSRISGEILTNKKYIIMTIQLNTDKHIKGTESLEQWVTEKISHALKHYEEYITRVEVHLSDLNADKGGIDDIQCKIEARVKGIQPVLVTSKNATKEIALDDAVDKMKAILRTTIEKMRND